ncbi:hypothetical protein DY000_02052996 [Brassica cretica]|uniref:Uncharacterized protein n=1 Tax=Brassica cretica TaxID=69181 RepID=A0ABQ7AHP0_BRACR|nr:hypothetical protein DY000_02052996 [Brassica cretica]
MFRNKQQKTSAYLNLRLDVLYKELNGKLETLDAHVMMLDAQISQTAEAVKKQEALVKGKAVESERHQVNAISDDDFGVVLEQEKLEEDAFLVESCMSIGSSYWCRPTSTAEHRSTSSAEHRSTPLLGSCKTVRIQSHSDFSARHPHPPTLARVKRDNIDRQQHNVIDRQQHGNIDRQQQKSSDRQPPIPYQTSVCLKTTEKISHQFAEAREQKQTLAETSFVESVDRRHLPGIYRHQTDGYEPAMGKQATKEEIPVEKKVKSRKPYIPKHLKREVNKEELEGFHKRVKRVPKDMSFEDAYHKYRLDAHVMMLDAQVSQTEEAVKKQEALVKGKAVESERHQVNAISDDFGEVLEQEKLEEDAFLVESCMSIGSSYWCRPTPTAEHRSTSSANHRSTPLLGSDKTVRISEPLRFCRSTPASSHPSSG